MKSIRTIVKSFIVAFSIYSKIPMPRFVWESDDMKYHLCFFPWVGAVIGLLEWLWYALCDRNSLTDIFYVTVAVAIPLLLTGGFHLDGFLDTCDALHSYQDREKKLEILKDPHVGAFAVIHFALYLLVAVGFLAFFRNTFPSMESVFAGCMVFFLARCFSGISVVTLPGAKNKGMLQTFSKTAEKNWLCIQAGLCAAGMIILSGIPGLLMIAAVCGTFFYYWHVSESQFGGITGDLAGFFVSLAELLGGIAFSVCIALGGVL